MEKLFINIVQMSIPASYLILAVLFVRFLLRKAPKSMRSFLWLLVGIRLLFPFTVESIFSLIPSTPAAEELIYPPAVPNENIAPEIANMEPLVSQPVPDTFTPAATKQISRTQAAVQVGTKLWIIGIAMMLGYMCISWIRLKRRVRMSIPVNVALDCSSRSIVQKIYKSSAIESPFLFGILKPRIYIPNGIADEELPYVVQHEMTHLKRRDYLIKPAGFLLLSVYWFNPFVWLAYLMLCKDIELICDEKVIRQLGASCKKAYSQALLNSASNRHMIAACPVAFGEVSVKERVKNVLNDKKPAFWVLVAAVLACIIVPVCFMTQKKTDTAENKDNTENGTEQGEDINIENLFAGSYEMLPSDQVQYFTVPGLTLQNDGRFSFFYDPASSYLCFGRYDWTGNDLHMVTDDGKYQYRFTYTDGGLLLFDAENSSDILQANEKGNMVAPLKDGSIFFKNSISTVLHDAEEMSQSINQELANGATMTVGELQDRQVSLSELQKQLTMGEMKTQRQLEKVNELQLTQEESAALKARLQELLQESESAMQQLEKDLAACQSVMDASENAQTAYNTIEQWAQAFCDRDGVAIVKLAAEQAQQDLVNRDLLQQGFDGEKDYVSFGWSSPWPWGGNYDEDTLADNYRIINVTDRYAEILYYAWVSDPHVTVWREQLTFMTTNDNCFITSETLQYMDYICTAAEFWLAYPDGITGTMMDYSYNGAGEALNDHAKNNRDSQGYNQLFEPDSAAVYLLNILNNPNKVGTQVTKSENDENTCTVTFEFYEDGSSVSVQMVQPYGSDGIWIPYSDPFDVSEAADTASIAPYMITTQNMDYTIAADAKQLEALFPSHHGSMPNVSFPYSVDLNGDGVEEMLDFIDLGYNGGDGGYALTVTDTKTGEKIPLPDGYTEENGFPIRTFYSMQQGEEDCLLIQLGEEKRCQTVATIMLNPLYGIYERKGLYPEFKRAIPEHAGEIYRGDALSGCNIVTYDNGENGETPVILLKTYVSGFLGHMDTLGYVITELRLQEDNTWSSRHYFLMDSCGMVDTPIF